MGVQFEVVEALVVAGEGHPELVHEEADHAVAVLQQQSGGFHVFAVDVGQAGQGYFDEFHASVASGLVAVHSQQGLQDQGLDEWAGVLGVKQLSEWFVIGDSEVGVPLVQPEQYPETDLLEHVEIGIVAAGQVSVEVEHLLDKDHEAVDVEFDDPGQVELDGGAQ